jgi:hypothetical protein
MTDSEEFEQDSATQQAADFSDAPVLPGDVASAGRSCSVILILLAAILLMICVSVTIRWYMQG